MKQIWFRTKDYGWGWVPDSFEGWITTIVYCVLVAYFTVILIQRMTDPRFNQIMSIGIYLFLVIVSTASFLALAYIKGEKPHWSWGKKKKD